jgi:hypothetical protein
MVSEVRGKRFGVPGVRVRNQKLGVYVILSVLLKSGLVSTQHSTANDSTRLGTFQSVLLNRTSTKSNRLDFRVFSFTCYNSRHVARAPILSDATTKQPRRRTLSRSSEISI